MLNKLWPYFLIVSIIYASFAGKIMYVNSSIFSATEEAVKLSLTLVGTMCLWNGIMEIASKTTLIIKLKKLLRPALKFLFPNINENEKVQDEISMNMIANIMGLGNAATPLGLKAMQSLQKKNKDKTKLSNEMAILIVINTASIQIIPTTVIAIRNSLGSNDASKIIVPIWISTVIVAVFVVMLCKILMKKF